MRFCILAGAGALLGFMGAASAAPAIKLSTYPAEFSLSERMQRDSYGAAMPAAPPQQIALKGLYEFSGGTWRIAPFAGLGVGAIDFGERMRAPATNDWVSGYQFTSGISIGFTQKLIGNFGYRWSYGEKGHFGFGSVPAKVELGTNRILVGLDYHLF
jgi:opacity protein-like surface antigen